MLIFLGDLTIKACYKLVMCFLSYYDQLTVHFFLKVDQRMYYLSVSTVSNIRKSFIDPRNGLTPVQNI